MRTIILQAAPGTRLAGFDSDEGRIYRYEQVIAWLFDDKDNVVVPITLVGAPDWIWTLVAHPDGTFGRGEDIFENEDAAIAALAREHGEGRKIGLGASHAK